MTTPEKLASKVESFKENLDDTVEEGLEDGMSNTEFEAENNLRRNDSVVNRSLISSITLDRDTIPTFKHSASVRVNAEHAPFVEYGTGSRQKGGPLKFPAPSPKPPIGPIKQWLIRKGTSTDNIQNVNLKTLNDAAPRRVDQQESLTHLANAIAEVIGKYGNRPHPYARPAARSGFDTTVDNVKRQMKYSVRRF